MSWAGSSSTVRLGRVFAALVVVCGAVAAGFGRPVQAATFVVYPTGDIDGSNSDTDRIQNAINSASHGDTILLKSVNDGITYNPA